MSSRLYRALCGAGDAFVAKSFPKGPINTIWHHEAGPKTIFFWAPFWKWTIVIAGIADLARPAHRTVIIFKSGIPERRIVRRSTLYDKVYIYREKIVSLWFSMQSGPPYGQIGHSNVGPLY